MQSFLSLPKDLICFIFSKVREDKAKGIPLVCKYFHQCVLSNHFRGWKTLTSQEVEAKMQTVQSEIDALFVKRGELKSYLMKVRRRESRQRQMAKLKEIVATIEQFAFDVDPNLKKIDLGRYSEEGLAYMVYHFHGANGGYKVRGKWKSVFTPFDEEPKEHFELQKYKYFYFLDSRSCNYCKKLSHHISKCPQLFCEICQTQGHKTGDCDVRNRHPPPYEGVIIGRRTGMRARRRIIYGPN